MGFTDRIDYTQLLCVLERLDFATTKRLTFAFEEGIVITVFDLGR